VGVVRLRGGGAGGARDGGAVRDVFGSVQLDGGVGDAAVTGS
jgi:hypothetical protein